MSETKREYDFFLNKKDESAKDGNKLVGVFTVRGGKAKNTDKPYLFMSGFSKELNGEIIINIKAKLSRIIEVACDAGLGESIAEVLAAKGVIGQG
jgi:hypothetical protein